MCAHSGLLITFEGIDGSGKSTQARRLAAALERQGYAPLVVRDPGGTALSERVRALLLDPSLETTPMAELMLFAAARAQLAAERLRPALEAGRVVVCDRFYDSTTAYQGGGRGLQDAAWMEDLHTRITGGLVPDRTYLLALSPEQARNRSAEARSPSEAADRMEAAGTTLQARAAEAYDRLAATHPDRFRRLDGSRSPNALHVDILTDVEALLDDPCGTPESGSGSPD